ncbi:hypothetical protein SH2C18_13690 [Clostridium sediminicola]|uniref:urease accessory protein UreH domain-containing protein n=1 Tax=Clostridium sediminicola TaxID=3114879 RepID=UPI0031F1D51F
METKLYVEGMTCSHCENKIIKNLLLIEGVISAKAIASQNRVSLVYDHSMVTIEEIIQIIENTGYSVVNNKSNPFLSSLAMVFFLLLVAIVVLKYGNSISYDFLPNIRQNMGYGTLLLMGLLTSVHCIAMCGGINISQCNKYEETSTSFPSLLYNLGRVTSYTIIGGIIGGIGTVLSFAGQTRGYVTIFVSAIMMLMAVKMLKIFQVQLPKFKLPKAFRKLLLKLSAKGPFFVGFANGFMPCGPLQSMQLYALGTGSIIRGALSMFYFSIGTFPLMFGLGFVSTLLNHKFSKNIMKYSGLLIFILSLTMFTRGAALAGIILPFQNNGNVVESQVTDNQLQEVVIHLSSNSYEPIRVKKNIPVRFIINAKQEDLNGCNNPVTIPSMNIEKTLNPGKNEIIFTPNETGKIAYTCWMGMITSYIEVFEDR